MTTESEHAEPLSLERILGVLRRRWWAIVVIVVLGAGSAFVISSSQQDEYTAASGLLFKTPAVAEQAAGVQGVSQSDPAAQRDTNLRLVKLGSVAQRASLLMDGRVSPARIQAAVSAKAEGQSNIVTLEATWTDPNRAAAIANAFARAFVQQQTHDDQATVQDAVALVRQQYAQLSTAQQKTAQGQALLDRIQSLEILKATLKTAQVVQLAQPPSGRSSPKVTTNTVLGGALGLFVGLALALVLDRLDRRLREPEDIEEAFGLPLLGVIPHSDLIVAGRGLSAGNRSDPDLEPFRMLRAHLRYFNVDRALHTMLVTSAAPGEGKTTIARNLAMAAASMGTSTLLIESDLRRPSLASVLGLSPSPGLATLLVEHQMSLASAVQQVEVAGSTTTGGGPRILDVLVAGAMPPNPGELVESHAMEALMDQAARDYELVVIDTPPLSTVSDAIPMLKRVDGVIVVSRVGMSRRDEAVRLRERLSQLEAPTLGVVANDLRRSGGRYGYTYGYGYTGA